MLEERGELYSKRYTLMLIMADLWLYLLLQVVFIASRNGIYAVPLVGDHDKFFAFAVTMIVATAICLWFAEREHYYHSRCMSLYRKYHNHQVLQRILSV